MLASKASFPNDLAQLASIRDFLREQLVEAMVAEDLVHDVVSATDEACSNVMEHAYPPGQREPGLELALNVDETQISVTITDRGLSFDPRKIPVPDLAKCRELFQTGGYGLYLMRILMDQVIYDIQPGIKNQVRLIKSRRPKSHAH